MHRRTTQKTLRIGLESEAFLFKLKRKQKIRKKMHMEFAGGCSEQERQSNFYRRRVFVAHKSKNTSLKLNNVLNYIKLNIQ